MCRHLGYLGPPITLDALLLAPEHSLLDQAKAPREQRASSLNADGFGVRVTVQTGHFWTGAEVTTFSQIYLIGPAFSPAAIRMPERNRWHVQDVTQTVTGDNG